MPRTRTPNNQATVNLLQLIRDAAESGQLDDRFRQQSAISKQFVEELKRSDRVDPDVLHKSVTI